MTKPVTSLLQMTKRATILLRMTKRVTIRLQMTKRAMIRLRMTKPVTIRQRMTKRGIGIRVTRLMMVATMLLGIRIKTNHPQMTMRSRGVMNPL